MQTWLYKKPWGATELADPLPFVVSEYTAFDF